MPMRTSKTTTNKTRRGILAALASTFGLHAAPRFQSSAVCDKEAASASTEKDMVLARIDAQLRQLGRLVHTPRHAANAVLLREVSARIDAVADLLDSSANEPGEKQPGSLR